MSTKKTPFVDISDALVRIVLMFIIILIGIICSISANAGVKNEKNPFANNIKKNNSYSCKALAKKHKASSNKVVKFGSKRPKWR